MLQPAEMSPVGGLDPLVDIINRSDRSTERQIVEGLEALDPVLAEEVKSRMFMFEDIVTLDDRSMQLVLREVDTADLALALKGVAEAVRDKITRNLSERAADDLIEEIELLGPVRLTPGRGGPAEHHPDDPPARGAGPDHDPPGQRR